MIYKKSFIYLYTFFMLQVILFSLLCCPTVTGQIQNPFLCQSTLPFSFGNAYSPFSQIGSASPFYTFNNFYNPANIFGSGTLGGGLLPIISPGLAANPYMAAATYYAAALLPADVVGAWSGTWTSTSTLVSLTGDISLTLVQATNDVAGTLLFLNAGTVKLASPVVGVIDVDLLTITGSGLLVGKTAIPYEIVLTGGVVGTVMEGEYIITETLLGNVIEQGTFAVSKL